MQIVSKGYNLHEMPNPIFVNNKKTIRRCLSLKFHSAERYLIDI